MSVLIKLVTLYDIEYSVWNDITNLICFVLKHYTLVCAYQTVAQQQWWSYYARFIFTNASARVSENILFSRMDY